MWARIEQDKVAEVTANDPAGRFHEALIWIECAGEVCEGWTYQDHQFRPPRPSPYHSWVRGQWVLDLVAETEGLRQQALAEVSNLMSAATQSMAPLKDAVELDIAIPAEVELYNEWRRYRVELNRVEQQAGFPRQITWPVAPLAIG